MLMQKDNVGHNRFLSTLYETFLEVKAFSKWDSESEQEMDQLALNRATIIHLHPNNGKKKQQIVLNRQDCQ